MLATRHPTSPIQIVCRIQAHPARAHLHRALASAISDGSLGLPCEVVLHSSDPPSPWAGYLECLRDLPGCTHLVVIQDDAIVCKNFAPALRLIAEATEDPVCLYVGIHSRKTTTKEIAKATGRYADIYWRDFVPVVAVLWPIAKAEHLAVWSQSAQLPGDPNPRSDDAVVGFWMRKTRQRVLCTVPSLVQHDDSVPSVKRGPGERRPQDALRPALNFAEDALSYDWTCAPSGQSVYTRRVRG